MGNPKIVSILLTIACFVFIGRIIGEFNCFGIFKREKDTTFSKMDNMIYIPICVYLNISLGCSIDYFKIKKATRFL
ncbi:DUF3995 domain-containing protein [Vagococcus teuberi]